MTGVERNTAVDVLLCHFCGVPVLFKYSLEAGDKHEELPWQ